MRRIFATSLFALALLVGGVSVFAAVAVPSVSAQVAPGSSMPNYSSTANQTPTNSQGGSSGWFAEGLAWVLNTIMRLFAWLLGVAALLLDYVVIHTVVGMGDYVNNLSAVGVAWRILRDIGNIALIFGFLAIGISTILDLNVYGYGTKMLPKLLLVAVLLNFSLFFSEAIIDVGNLFATEFYTQINGGSIPDPANTSVHDEGISNKIMYQLGLQNIYGAALNDPSVLNLGSEPFVAFMAIILFLVAAFVFFMLSFILLARFVMLLLLVIVSPIGIAGLAVPKLEGLAKDWWKKLVGQAMTAPVLLLLLYVALKVITDTQFLGGYGTNTAGASAWTGFSSSGTQTMDLQSFAGILLSFLVAMGLLLVVAFAAKRISAVGADWASSWGGRLSFGLTAYGLRNSFGWASTAGARKFQSSKYARVPVFGTSVSRALSYGSKSSFDVRGSGVFGALPGHINAGKAQKGGYAGDEKKAIDARVKYGKSLEMTKGEKAQMDAAKDAKQKADQSIKDFDAQRKLIENQQAEAVRNKKREHDGATSLETIKVTAAQKELATAEATLATAKARATADPRSTESANALAVAQAAQAAAAAQLIETTRQREALQAAHETELAELRAQHKDELAVKEEEKKGQETTRDTSKQIMKDLTGKPQKDYARYLGGGFGANEGWNKWKLGNSYRNVSAIKKLTEEAKKKKGEKEKDKFYEVFEKVAKEKEEGGDKH